MSGELRSSKRHDHTRLVLDAESELRILGAIKACLTVHDEELDDPELMLLVAEGQTSILELIDLLLDADFNDEGLIAGAKLNKDTLAVRLHRLEKRRTSRRAIIEQALALMEVKSLERPVATITLSDRAPALIVDEESQIPAQYFDLRPVLSRRLLKEALEAGQEIVGARLSSGVVSLTVRRR